VNWIRAWRAACGALAVVACAESPLAPERVATASVAGWSTWVVPSASALRPPAPAAELSAASAAEIDEIVRLQSSRSARTDSLVRHWDGDPGAPWSRLAIGRLDFYWPLLPDVRLATPARAARTSALLHVALHDAIVATWEAKYAYMRRAPAQASGRVRPLVPIDGTPSYPSAHAAAAAAAAAILSYAFPIDDSATFDRMAREAAESRIVAGAAYRSDVDAGWALGRAVAERVIERAMSDGSADPWHGTVPVGAGVWTPTPPRRVKVPFDATAGQWRTWVISAGNMYRLPPPPALGSPAFRDALDEVKRYATGGRTGEQLTAARYWATDAPSIRWELAMEDELARRRWSIPHAARARAYTSVAMYDAFVACWDSKYTYWLARPVTMDSTVTPAFSTPPFPSYPSGHSTISNAAAVVMGELFADAAASFARRADEASLSRVWAGVHYRFDVELGDSLGAKVGRDVVARMRSDGAAAAVARVRRVNPGLSSP
jgi:membrane-associated phospholipid phosphatase